MSRTERMLAGRGFQVVENPGFGHERDAAETAMMLKTPQRTAMSPRTLVAGTKDQLTQRKSTK